MTNRIVASFTAFNAVYNYWFYHKTDFLPFGTLEQYQGDGLTQYLISHCPSIYYLEDKPNIFLRNFGIYLTKGCHTEGGNISTDRSNKRNTSTDWSEWKLFMFVLFNKIYFSSIY